MKPINRRRFLVHLAARLGVGTAVFSGITPLIANPSATDAALRRTCLEDILAAVDERRSSLRRIGTAWLRSPGATAKKDTLIDTLLRTVPGLRDACRKDRDTETTPILASKALQKRIIQDFEEARTLDLEGYQLSVTECRVAALVALSAGPVEKNS